MNDLALLLIYFRVISPGSLKKLKTEDQHLTNNPSPIYDKILPLSSLNCLHKNSTCDEYLKQVKLIEIQIKFPINYYKVNKLFSGIEKVN